MHRRLLCPGGAATDGKVCLSLLGTWAGQAWDPAATTLRNVIFDGLQQHILAGVNDRPGEPYYNEPDLPDDPARSVAYNEEARLLTLRGLLHLASRPLDKCAGILGAHLRAHGPALLDRTRREIAGADAAEPEPAAEEPEAEEPEAEEPAAEEPVVNSEQEGESTAPHPYTSLSYRDRAGGFLRGLEDMVSPRIGGTGIFSALQCSPSE